MLKKNHPALTLFLGILFINYNIFAATPPASQQMSGQERARQIQEEEENLEKQVEQTKAKEKQTVPQPSPEAPQGQQVLVKTINVNGVTLFSNDKIRDITSQYENKELSLREIQKIADLITDLYRKKGYVVSRAYIPPQSMDQGVLVIKVLESTVGNIQIQGKRFHSKHLIKSYLTLQKGDAFNYNDIKRDLENINDQPDMYVKAVLIPGQEPGSTDIILNVNDSLPVHVSLGYNNYLSSFLRHNIYSSIFTDNNLTGHDDIITFEYERGEANDYYSYTTRYLYPVTNSLNLGAYAGRSNEILGGEYKDADSRGKSRMYGFNGSQNVFKNDDMSFNLNFGFDYMDVYNFLNGSVASRDRLRVARGGFDFNCRDDFGATLISDDYNYGIPGIMGGTQEHLDASDTPTSRSGVGGQFVKDTLNILRLQRLLFDATLLWKNQLQFSPHALTSTEQFQAGGPSNNRGYSVAEAVGDKGYAMSWELAEPPYFIPKYWRVPYTNTTFYDSIRFLEFYDWSNVHLNSLQPGDVKNKTLRSAGGGFRINISKNVFIQYEIAWPLGARSSDGKGVHHWLEVTITF